MSRHVVNVLWAYWLVLTVGFTSSLAIFTQTVQQQNTQVWLAIALAVGAAGYSMTLIGIREYQRAQRLALGRHSAVGIAVGLLAGIVFCLSPYLLGFIDFYLIYICWIVFAVASVYFAVKLRTLRRPDDKYTP